MWAHTIWLLGKSEERFVLWATTARTREKKQAPYLGSAGRGWPWPTCSQCQQALKSILICLRRRSCACQTRPAHFLDQLSHIYFQFWLQQSELIIYMRQREYFFHLIVTHLCCWRQLIFLIRATDQLKERKTIIRSINQRDKMLSFGVEPQLSLRK